MAGSYGEFRQGWKVVLSALLGVGLGLSPVPFYTIGILAPHLARAFGWSYAQIFFGVTVTTLCVVVVSPLVGVLADRYGVRRVALASLSLFGLAFMALAFSNGSLLLYYATLAVMAVLGAGSLPITWSRAVNNRFERRRGLALGLSLMGSGLFGYAAKPFTAWVIAEHGWRAAYIAIGALPLVVALPVGLMAFHDIGPRGATASARRQAEVSRQAGVAGLPAPAVFASWRFWVMAAAVLPISFAIGGPIPNMENILHLAGFAPATVVGLTSLIGLSVVCGRTGGGWLIDRFWAPGAALVLLGIPALGCWMLARGPSSVAAAGLCVFLIGFAAGLEFDLLAFLVSRYFGLRSYGTVYGAIYSVFALGAGSAPAVFGMMFDRSHSYTVSLQLSAVLMLVGAALLLTLGRYPSALAIPHARAVEFDAAIVK